MGPAPHPFFLPRLPVLPRRRDAPGAIRGQPSRCCHQRGPLLLFCPASRQDAPGRADTIGVMVSYVRIAPG